MITLPTTPAPSEFEPDDIDFGIFQRPSTGAGVTRFDRPGNRFRAKFTFPPMPMDTARVFSARLSRARREGLRVPVPLGRVTQGTPGTSAVVNGGGAAGTSLPLRGVNAGWQAREGYWLTAIDAAGVHYLHRVSANATAGAGGTLTLTIEPPLRAPLADGNAVLLAAPLMEGIVTEITPPQVTPSGLVAVAFTLEEAA